MKNVSDDVYDAINELSVTLINAFELAGDLPTTGSDYDMGKRVAYLDCAQLVRRHASTHLQETTDTVRAPDPSAPRLAVSVGPPCGG